MSTQYIRSTPPELLLKLWHQFFEFPILPLANHQVKQLPSLLHPLENNKEASYGLFKPVEKKVYEIDLPKARGKLLKGSSFSWIGKVEDMHSRSPTDIYLINPLTRVQIKLPPRNNFLDWYIEPTRSSRRRIRLLISPMLFMNTILRQKGTWTKISQSLMMWVYLIWKVVLSSAPCYECVVVTLYGHAQQLASCKCNNKKWTHIYIIL